MKPICIGQYFPPISMSFMYSYELDYLSGWDFTQAMIGYYHYD